MSDFAIQDIYIEDGKYIFRNGIIVKRLTNVEEEEMFNYIERLNDQLTLTLGAIRTKRNN